MLCLATKMWMVSSLHGSLDFGTFIRSFSAPVNDIWYLYCNNWLSISTFAHAEYRKNVFYLGCSVGRVANRIKKATFILDEKTYHVTANVPPNSLHGGTVGFNHVGVVTKFAPFVYFHISTTHTHTHNTIPSWYALMTFLNPVAPRPPLHFSHTRSS